MFDKKKNAAESYGVIGLGRFGTALVKTLAAAGKEVIAVDKDEAKVKAVRGYTDYAFVIDELDETSLKETGMQNCGTVTICIGEQIDISILTTMLVTKLGVPHVISKAASEVHGEVLKRLGAEVVYPIAFRDGTVYAVIYDNSDSRLYDVTWVVSLLLGCAVLALTLWRTGTLEQILHTGQQLNTWLPQTTQQTEPELLGKPVNDKAPQPSTAPLGKPIEDKKQLTEKLSDALDALLHHSADTTEK